MEVLSHKDLHCREFGSALFFVADFFKWLNEKHLRISTIPDIADYEFIQIESFLCAIERAASQVTTEEALEIVQIDPLLANDRMAETNPRWLVGAEAHRKWRIKIHEAVNAKELVPLDYGSKLPIAAPDATPAAKVEAGTITTPAPAATVMTNQKIWDDSKLKALWEQSIMPGVTITSLAKKHGVSRQRIATLIQTAKQKFSMNNSWQNSSFPPQTRFVKGSKY